MIERPPKPAVLSRRGKLVDEGALEQFDLSAFHEAPAVDSPQRKAFNLGAHRMRQVDAVQIAAIAPEGDVNAGQETTWLLTIASDEHPAVRDHLSRRARELRARLGRSLSRDKALLAALVDVAVHIVDWTPVRIARADFPFSQRNALMLLLDERFAKTLSRIVDRIERQPFYVRAEPSTTDGECGR